MKVWKGYQKGINLGGWYSQCDYSKERFEHFIEKEDLARIAGWGLDHVRVPVDYNLVEDAEGNYMEEGFAYIDRIISWCEEYKLNMILDLHKTAGFSFDFGEQESGFFDNEKLQERFYRLWTEFAKRYGKYEFVAFELLNEVTDPAFMPIWNRIADTCIDRIRAYAPTTYILVGGYWNNSIKSVPALNLPKDDYIVYNFHCYDPIIFTHQGAYWVPNMPTDFRMPYDETYASYAEKYNSVLKNVFGGFDTKLDLDSKFGPEYFEEEFEEAIQVAEERNVALYCGEYGVIDRCDPEDILKWYKAIHTVFRKYNIGSAAWSYREMDYGFVDEHFAPVLDRVIAVITEKE